MFKTILGCVLLGSLIVAGVGSYYAAEQQSKAYKEEQKEKEENQENQENQENLILYAKVVF